MIEVAYRPGSFGRRALGLLPVFGALAAPAGLFAQVPAAFPAPPAVSAAAAPASTPVGAEPCAATAPVMPEGMSGWNRRRPLEAARALEGLTAAGLTIGRAVEARLHPVASVRYAPPPLADGKGARALSGFGGLFAFSVAEAGVYRVALGAAAWIDVAGDGGGLVSVGHAHGPACSGVRKMVDFALAPGRYRLALSRAEGADMPVMIVRLR